MTSPIEDYKPADDGAPSDDDVPLTSGETPAEAAETPSSAPFQMLGLAGGDACGADGCSQG